MPFADPVGPTGNIYYDDEDKCCKREREESSTFRLMEGYNIMAKKYSGAIICNHCEEVILKTCEEEPTYCKYCGGKLSSWVKFMGRQNT